MEYFFELFLGGLTRGSIYALIALGYTMVYGIVELINFAHGEIYMIGAFTALIVVGVLTLLGWNQIAILIIAALAAVIWSSAYGFTLEKIAYKPLRKAPRLSALISAIGMSLFLQNYVLLAQTSDFMPFPALIPDFAFMEPVAHIIGSPELVILITTTIVMILLTFLIQFTKIGKAMRATAQDREMAMLVGVDVNRVISMTFIIGSATAAIGGVLIASHIGQINFYIGFIAGIKALWRRCAGWHRLHSRSGTGLAGAWMDRVFFHRIHFQRLRGCLRLCFSGLDPDLPAGRHSGSFDHGEGLIGLMANFSNMNFRMKQ